MLKFICEIECNGAAFLGAANLEVARILKQAANDIERGKMSGFSDGALRLYDLNGGSVGYAEFDQSEPSVFEKKQAGG